MESPKNLEAEHARPAWLSDTAALCYIALATLLAHILTGGRYGFHRDELATLDDARHLAWGYIAYPPITPLFGRVSLRLFGTSLAGFRFFAYLAQAAAVLFTGLIAREFGARRGAQIVAALAAVPHCLAGTLMQYGAFDYFFWVLAAYFVVRLLKSGNAKWWIGIGSAIGFGMMSKYTMAFFAAGVAAGILLTDARRFLKSAWLWLGVALALLIFLPNLIWEIQHNFVSFAFLRTIHARDIALGWTNYFLPLQFGAILLAFPLAIAGLYFCFASSQGRRYRVLGWMYLTPVILFLITRARPYYLAPAYPMLYAAGAVWGQEWLANLKRVSASLVKIFVSVALAVDIVATGAFTLPIAPVGSAWWNHSANVNGVYRDEIGWPDLVQAIAEVRDSLPADERAHVAVLAANYGEAGAVNLFGPRYGLPSVISGGNSFWAHGHGDPPPQTVIVVGFSHEFVENHFASCQLAAKIWNQYGVTTKETQDYPEIYVCRDLKMSWPELWKNFQYFG